MNVISIGEVLWDVAGAQEFLGGAPLNFAIHLSYLGHHVAMISAVGNDERGRRIMQRLNEIGLSTSFIQVDPDHPTGWVDVRFGPQGEPEYKIHRPVAYDFPKLSPDQLRRVLSPPVDWIYFGTLQQMSPVAARLTERFIAEAPAARRFYDPNLRAHSYSPEMVLALLERATVVKLSEKEAEEISSMCGTPGLSLENFCRKYAQRFRWEAICVTLGAAGCVALVGNEWVVAPGYQVATAEPVGAGDAFAAAFLHGLSSGWPAPQIADFANRVAALVVSRPGAVPRWTVDEAMAIEPRKP